MAFKATRKPSAKVKKETTTEPLNSVDDFVGAPVGESSPPVEAPAPVAETYTQPPQAESTGVAPAPVRPPRREQSSTFDPMSQAAPYGRPQHGGYRDNRGPSRFHNNNNNGGGYRRGGMGGGGRRDFGNSNPQQGPTQQDNLQYMQDANVPTETVQGLLDIMPEGHGFLRPKFTPGDNDVYISMSQIRRFLLRNGDIVVGQARLPKENERYYGLLKVEQVNGKPADQMDKRPKFEDLTPIYPNQQLRIETGQTPLSSRIIDLVAPIGFGQRGLIVSPPKAGKTTMLKELAAGISANYPNVHLMAALIGERPEEVTDITRNLKGEVLASNFDESPQEQTRIAEVALERAKRLVEMGKDVIILLDSITRLARAYNLVVNPSGRTLSGGFDPAALYPAKRFLGAARCVEPPEGSDQPTGGSLTVIGTALIDTGSRMDDLIYEEFKGTGNMELHLSRQLQERRVFPAIDVTRSGTRHDELLLGEENTKRVTTLRHMLSMLSDEERTLMLIDRLSRTASNQEFLDSLSKGD